MNTCSPLCLVCARTLNLHFLCYLLGAFALGHNNCSVISFDLSSANQGEELVKAELLLYTKLRTGAARLSPLADTRTVRVYRVTDGGAHKELVAEKTILFSHFLSGEAKTRWETFDVLPAVRKWLSGAPNHGFHLDVLSNGESLQCGSRRDVHFVRGYRQRHRPILLVYSHDLSEPIEKFPDQSDISLTRTRRDLTPEQREHIARLQQDRNSANPRHCVRQEYQLDFRNLNDQVLQPKKLDIGVCRGECMRPTSPHAPQTNHARIQAILHQNHSLRNVIPEPCCSPQELESVNFLFFQGDTLTMRTKHDLVVKSCGCR